MLGVEARGAAAMTRDRLAELVARYPDRPAG
ncbi:phage tail assembly chaperone [Paracoccus thiocyanatus]